MFSSLLYWFNLISLRRVNKFPYECIAVSLAHCCSGISVIFLSFSHHLTRFALQQCKKPEQHLFAAVGRRCRLMNHIQLPSSAHNTTQRQRANFNAIDLTSKHLVECWNWCPLAWLGTSLTHFLIVRLVVAAAQKLLHAMNLNDNIQVRPTARMKVNQGRLAG